MRDNKEGVGEGTTLHVCRKYYGTFMHCKRRRREDQSETRNMVHMASIRRSGMDSYRLAGQDVLDVADCARSFNRRPGKDAETLLRRVQHLLDVGQDARDIGGDERVL